LERLYAQVYDASAEMAEAFVKRQRLPKELVVKEKSLCLWIVAAGAAAIDINHLGKRANARVLAYAGVYGIASCLYRLGLPADKAIKKTRSFMYRFAPRKVRKAIFSLTANQFLADLVAQANNHRAA